MTGTINALRADRTDLLNLCAGFTDASWQAGSGCEGWSVKDVVSHLGALYWLVVDPVKLPAADGLPTERAQARYVEHRRSMTAAEVLADYESVSAAALRALSGMARVDTETSLGDLGTYPVSFLPNAFCFDHYVHIRLDLFAPRGPLTSMPPPSDELRLRPALDWIEAALPQQNADIVTALPGSVEITIDGPAARTVTVGHGDPIGHVSSDAETFIRRVTQRAEWPEGSPAGLSQLHVF